MSDNARTTARYTVVGESVATIATRLAEFFDFKGDSALIPDPAVPLNLRALFRPIADTSQKYQQPEWLETSESEPQDKSALALMANKYGDFAIHTSLILGSRAFRGSVYVYRVTTVQSFVRLSFHSALTVALRGTNEFGVGVTIDQEIKANLVEMILGTCRVIGAGGFVYGLEGDRTDPLTVGQLESFLLHPEPASPLFGAYLTGIDKSIVPRAALVAIWEDESVIKQATTGIIMVDLLQDSPALVEDDDEPDEEKEDVQGEQM